jgi:NADH dehydrogenase
MEELKDRGINVITNSFVTKIEPNQITFKDGTIMKSHTIVWVAGVSPVLSEIKGLVAGQKGRIDTNEFLQTTYDTNIFSLGDASGSYPMLAQIAVQQAKTVAKNIKALIENDKLTAFKFTQKGLLLSIGQWYAIGNFFGMTFKGKIMWWIWRTAYLFNFLSWRKRFEIASEWTSNLFYPRDITYLK